MDWDDEFDEIIHGTSRAGSTLYEGSEAGLDPMDISHPASAYLFLSDDAQDERNRQKESEMPGVRSHIHRRHL